MSVREFFYAAALLVVGWVLDVPFVEGEAPDSMPEERD